ncbi:MAG: hypothetical protein PWP56_1342 [Acetobacterium sp.]|nr:hypothetical protein [Acetobacterium sp.]
MDTIEKIYESNEAFVGNENFKGVKKIIVDNYSDEAHFVYEMLQNADDAEATEITFDLREDRLIVSHDGKAFTEKDLEGICSISKGTKSDDYTKIGKFGIGFKSVFVYTESPQVFSGDYAFEIRELVLPKRIKNSTTNRKERTTFILPFNAKKTEKIAKDRIYKKLDSLHEEAILFLQNVKKINTVVGEEKNTIEKTLLDSSQFLDDSFSEHIRITKMPTEIEHSDDEEDEYEDDENMYSYYYLLKKTGITLLDTDDEGEIVEVNNQTVMIAYLEVDGKVCALSDDYYYDHDDCYFVFFPTRISSNCEFLIHAPFVTKSSRDTIALNNVANDDLMKNVGILVADSMIVLAKEEQLSVDLIERMFFSDGADGFGNEIIFNSFKDEYIKLLRGRRAIIPCSNQTYRSLQSVLFTSETVMDCDKVVDLFGIKWLSDFFGTKNEAHFCYVDHISDFFDFIEEAFVCRKMKILDIVENLGSDFYAEKTVEWFIRYVDLLIAKDNYGGYHPCYDNLDQLPLVRTRGGKHYALEESGKIYLNNGTLDEKLLEDPKVDYIYREIFKLKEYSTELSDAKEAINDLTSDADVEFSKQVELLRKIMIAVENKKIPSDEIADKKIIIVENQKSGEKRKVAPKDALSGRWERTNGSFDLYVLCKDINIELTDSRYFESFTAQELKKIGCRTDGLSFEKGRILDFFRVNGMTGKGWNEKVLRPLVGKANNRQFQPLYQLSNFEAIIKAPMSIEKSVIILRLAKEFDTQIKDWTEWSSRQDFGSTAACQGYDECYSLFGATIALSSWLYDKKENLVRPSEVTSDELAVEYRKIMTADIADKIGLKRSSSEKINTRNKELETEGLFAIPIEEKEAYEAFRRQQEAKKVDAEFWSQLDKESEDSSSVTHPSNHQPVSHYEDENSDQPLDPSLNVLRDIVKKTKAKNKRKDQAEDTELGEIQDVDQDEYTPATVNYKQKIERAKQKSAAEIDKITYLEELDNKIENSTPYSYGWFKALLEMESINSGEANQNSREVSISFAKVEREPGTKRTLVLKHPNRYIPQFMEELADIPLVLHIGDKTKTVAIEVANIKSYTLRVKIKDSSAIDGIDLNAVQEATINAQSPSFLLEELRKQFAVLGFDDDFNMKDKLCENIEFIFGPPGTGKTTYLAKNVLIPLMEMNTECKVLVLAPTNKAADVLVRRIMEVSSEDQSYAEWLVRFGATGDEEIEQSAVFREKTFDIRTLSKNVTVTTMARFPYDFFMPQGARIFLHGINWDFIVIDEASMIPLANIIFPLYKKTPRKFIIAGDPFQIEPITSVERWKDENIYKMVELNSFTRPETKPYPYEVKLLTIQYRSIPDIGGVFSNFAYGGILKHYRDTSSQRPLNVGDDLGVETLNIIKYPVSKYESIYRCKRLQHSSSYQVYSALFTYEYVCYLSKEIARNNPGELYKIGIIAPYRAQADMIDKLLAAERLPQEVDVQVDTIHGFQGDECDIIFAVFNTPPTISSSEQMFLNKKNIINVSISRARDFLFIVMPDDNTENIGNLRLVKRVENLARSTDAWNEFESPVLEDLMFGDSHYLENNAFSTSHQSVNVYGLPEQIYEVRTEDAAVDVQVYKAVKSVIVDSTHQPRTAEEKQHSEQKQLVSKQPEYVDSYDLDETLIPEKLWKAAIDLPVKGAMNGWCYLVPYDGKLKDHSIKPCVGMFIPQLRNGQEKMVSVSVVEADRMIYISADMFKLYEQGLSQPEGIELRRNRF